MDKEYFKLSYTVGAQSQNTRKARNYTTNCNEQKLCDTVYGTRISEDGTKPRSLCFLSRFVAVSSERFESSFKLKIIVVFGSDHCAQRNNLNR